LYLLAESSCIYHLRKKNILVCVLNMLHSLQPSRQAVLHHVVRMRSARKVFVFVMLVT